MIRPLVAFVVAIVVVGLFFVLRPDSRASGPREQMFEVSVEDGEMVPRELRVGEGDRVTLRVETDRALELHVHGYDVERGVGPGDGVVVAFGADLTGRFGIEDHRFERELGTLVVRPR